MMLKLKRQACLAPTNSLPSCFFSHGQHLKGQKNVSVFSLIRLRSKLTEHFENCKKNMRSERTEMAVKERVLRIIEFSNMSVDYILF